MKNKFWYERKDKQIEINKICFILIKSRQQSLFTDSVEGRKCIGQGYG